MRLYVLLTTLLLACGTDTPPPQKSKQSTPEKAKPDPPADSKAAPNKIESEHPGAQVYNDVCLSCHQVGGDGFKTIYPPLKGSEWLKKSDDVLIRIIMHGLQGKITVMGKEFGSMAMVIPQPLTDSQIADVLTFTRQHFGGFEQPITAAQVKGVRDLYPSGHASWTMETLKEFDIAPQKSIMTEKSKDAKK